MKLVSGRANSLVRNIVAIAGCCCALLCAGCGGSSTPPPDKAPPSAPANLVAASTSPVQINLSWSASTDNVGVTGYKVERCQGATCSSFAQIAAPATPSHSDTGLTGSSSYSYRVRATDAAGNLSAYSGSSTAATMPPTFTAPSNLTAAAASSSQINLSWTAATETGGTITQYLIERCSGAGCSNFVQVSSSATATFNDTGLTAATSYSYRVRATDAASNFSSYSAAATASTTALVVIVSVSPKRAAITTGQTQSFVATVTGSSNLNVTWAVDSIPAGNSTVGNIDVNGKYTPPAGGAVHVVTATSVADASKNATVTVAVTDLPGVFTYHNNLSRDGANTKEYALTTTSVTGATFGKLFSCAVDGAIYAQPLWVANVAINGVKHNLIVVATQHDSVYAFDADANPCSVLWHVSLIDAAHGGTAGEAPVPSSRVLTNTLVGNGFGDIEPEVGVTGTPVIDPSTNTVYVVSKSVRAAAPTFFQRIHALDLITGTEKFAGPKVISASVAGDGDGSSGGIVAFDSRNEHQRAGLALVNGVVYIAWASHEDHDPYHGWVIGYNAATLGQVPNAVFNTTPNHIGTVSYSRGGIWMGGGAPAADSGNNLYLITGNGTYDGVKNFGDSILRLSTTSGLTATDWFTPNNQANLDLNDTDFGSGAATVLVDLPAAPVHQLLIGGGKEGTLFILDRTNLGHLTAGDTGVVQHFPASNEIFATPAFWQNKLYFAAKSDTLKMFTLDPTQGVFTPASGPSATSHSSNIFEFPGATPSVSATGSTNGIVWALDNSQFCSNESPGCGPAILHAYDANNLTTELWNSSQAPSNRDKAGNAVKFAVPTVANGKLYVGTRGTDNINGGIGELDVYGLLP